MTTTVGEINNACIFLKYLLWFKTIEATHFYKIFKRLKLNF